MTSNFADTTTMVGSRWRWGPRLNSRWNRSRGVKRKEEGFGVTQVDGLPALVGMGLKDRGCS